MKCSHFYAELIVFFSTLNFRLEKYILMPKESVKMIVMLAQQQIHLVSIVYICFNISSVMNKEPLTSIYLLISDFKNCLVNSVNHIFQSRKVKSLHELLRMKSFKKWVNSFKPAKNINFFHSWSAVVDRPSIISRCRRNRQILILQDATKVADNSQVQFKYVSISW